ncbi:TI13B translocase, partial [Acromyrmex heyeri]
TKIKKHIFEFLKNKPNIIFTRADKENIIVALLDKDSYINKVNQMLQVTKKITSKLKTLLTRWKDQSYISPECYKYFNCNDGLLSLVCGLPKVHKPLICPFIIIVSSIDSLLYKLVTFLQKILHDSIPMATNHIKNNFDLVNKLKGNINNGISLISFVVISLFTNFHIKKMQHTYRDEFLMAIRFVLNFTYFSYYDNYIYQQKFGITMINAILDKFNLFHSKLQFTLEVGTRINFLDIMIIISNNIIKFDKNLDFIIKVLLDNKRMKSLINKKTLIQNKKTDNEDVIKNSWFTISFNEYNFNKFKHITKDLNMRLFFFSMNKKDPLSKLSRKNVIYKIKCKDYNATYIEQALRQLKLKTRITEHKRNIRKMTEKCFKKCIGKPGTSLDSSEQKCVAMCMDRYMDSFNLVSKTYSERLQRERNRM